MSCINFFLIKGFINKTYILSDASCIVLCILFLMDIFCHLYHFEQYIIFNNGDVHVKKFGFVLIALC
jgi:hypothetical protein